MTEFLKNNPIALRHCLLYKFFHEESAVEEAFDDFCETVGYDVIKEEEFQYWFYQFDNGKFNEGEQPIPDMRDIFRNDKYALRACILYESIEFKCHQFTIAPEFIHEMTFSAYERFCKVIGDDVMEYREFEFWFYRFLNGKFYLNYERNKDKKVYKLMDMPIDIMRNIVEYLNIRDRISLENTSRSLRYFSQDGKVLRGHLTFEAVRHSDNIKNREKDCVLEFKDSETALRSFNYWKQGFQDFKKILQYPRLFLETLTIWLSHENSESLGGSIEDALKVTHPLHVKHISLHVHSMKTLLNILPSLEPGYLTTISIISESEEAEIEELVEMEQWKQAKFFDMRYTNFIGPLHHLYHFKEFDACCSKFSVEDVRGMKEILLKSPDFDRCTLYFRESDNPMAIRREFGGIPIEGSSKICHHPISNSIDYFEISIVNHWIQIVRKKK